MNNPLTQNYGVEQSACSTKWYLRVLSLQFLFKVRPPMMRFLKKPKEGFDCVVINPENYDLIVGDLIKILKFGAQDSILKVE